MAAYRIYRLKESQRQQFRWAPHTRGVTTVKPKDYEAAGSIEAPSAYSAWFGLKETGQPLGLGDLLEVEGGELLICKYVGFEEARWILPEVESGLESQPLAAGQPVPPSQAASFSEKPLR